MLHFAILAGADYMQFLEKYCNEDTCDAKEG